MTSVDVAEAKRLLEAAQFGPLYALNTGVKYGDHWYICDEGESVASISANDGEDEELREPRAELIAFAVNNLLGLIVDRERLQERVKQLERWRRHEPAKGRNYRCCEHCDEVPEEHLNGLRD